MLGLNRPASPGDSRNPPKAPLAPLPPAANTAGVVPSRQSGGPAPGAGEPPRPTVDPLPAVAIEPSEPATSKLFVGVNIKLKGVEISDCDVLVVEGQVEATVSSKAMQVAKPGSFTGTANIDVAEIHGEFSGELTARTRLVVHGTGRVSGTVRYGKLVVAEGGEINGDVRQIDAAARAPEISPAAKAETRPAQASMLPRNDRGAGSERLAPTGS
jgi:cytoskeletal protein CcmA (bactofilin family)